MQPFEGRYNTDGPWFKGNTHVHTTVSDGALDYRDTAAFYAEWGYDFLFVTDHQRAADIEKLDGLPLLALNGIEIDGRDDAGAYYHVVALGFDGPVDNAAPFVARIEQAKKAGAVVVVAHPCWTGNSVEEVLRHEFDGVEIYNNICHYLNGKSLAAFHYDRMLEQDVRTLAFSVDDAHLQAGQTYDGGWIMVSAPSATKEDILLGITSGNFYSTQGPRFESIRFGDGKVSVRTSPVLAVRMTDNTSWGKRVYRGGEAITEAEFSVTEERAYVRLEIEDDAGRLAWTNAVLRAG